MTDATYAAIMFGIYLTGFLVLLGVGIHSEWSWRKQFREPLPGDLRSQVWTLTFLLFGVTVAFVRFL